MGISPEFAKHWRLCIEDYCVWTGGLLVFQIKVFLWHCLVWKADNLIKNSPSKTEKGCKTFFLTFFEGSIK